jgi:hypothetical protein
VKLVYLFTRVQLVLIFDEVLALLLRSEWAPVGQHPRQGIRSDEFSAWAGVQLRLLILDHLYPLCRSPDVSYLAESPWYKRGIAIFAPLIFYVAFLLLPAEDTMKQSEHFLENAANCAQMAERAADEPSQKRYKRMEAAWRALAAEQDWLDGEVAPALMAKEKHRPCGAVSLDYPTLQVR